MSANGFVSVNVVSRIGLSNGIATDGRLTIDDVAPFTIDKAYWRGHYYCDKSPGISLLCVPASYVANLIADQAGMPKPLLQRPPFKGAALVRYALHAYGCFISTTLLFAGLAVFAFGLGLSRFDVDRGPMALVTIALAFGSPLFIWSTTLLGHAAGTALLFLGFATSWLDKGKWSERTRSILAGLALSVAMLIDLTTAPPGLFVALYLMLADGERHRPAIVHNAVWMLVGALPALVTLGIYNQLAFGSPTHLGYASVTGFTGMKQGFFGLTYPSSKALFGITLSAFRGLVWISPISFVALISLLLPWPRAYRAMFALTTVIVIYYLLLNSSYFYWTGGRSLGPRHVTPMIPFILFAFGLRMNGLRGCRLMMTTVVVAVSVLITLVATSVNVLLPDDGQSMLGTHVLPHLTDAGDHFVLARLGANPWVLVAVQWVLALRAAAIVGWRPIANPDRPTD